MNHEKHVQGVRGEIVASKRALADIDPNARNVAEVQALVSQHLDSAEARGIADLDRWVGNLACGHHPGSAFALIAQGQPPRLELGPLLVALIGRDRVEKAVNARIAAVVASGPSATDRAEARGRALADLHALEVSEEAAIRAAAADGVVIDRRADALPEIVLARQGDDL